MEYLKKEILLGEMKERKKERNKQTNKQTNKQKNVYEWEVKEKENRKKKDKWK